MTTLTLQQVARALSGEVSNNQVRAPGPGHSPKDRSLSVMLDTNAPGGFVVNTFSPADDPITCRDYVAEKLGLPAFKPNGRLRRRRSDGDVERALAKAFAIPTNGGAPGSPDVFYIYKSADGTPYLRVKRTANKDFFQYHWDGARWLDKKPLGPKIPYRLPELLASDPADPVYIVEGEKDADRIAAYGLIATTTSSGAKAPWVPELNEHFRNRHIVILPDNDQPGRWYAYRAATGLFGIAASIKILDLPGLGDKQDVSDWLDAGNLWQNIPVLADKAPLWLPDPDKPAPPLDDTPETEETKTDKPSPLPFLNIAAWLNQPVPVRQWTVKDRIPANNVTLLSGEGSVGKSILSLHLATAVVLGRDWLGTLPEPGAAMVVCCEDDDSELWRRLDLIFQHYNASYSDFKDLHLLSLAGQDTVMTAPEGNGTMKPTKLFERICEAACDIRPKLIVLDNSADIFAGNENDRAQVRQFIGLLRGVAIASGAGLLLTSHPSLTGISSGTGLSGSTAWNASVRSRLYFKRAVTDKNEEPDPDLRVLEVMKNNYGPVGETITLRWKNGLFVPVGGATNLEKLAFEQAAQELFLALLRRFKDQGRNLSDRPHANNYGPAQMAGEEEATRRGIKKRHFETAMRNLFAAGKVIVEPYGPPSKGWSRLAAK